MILCFYSKGEPLFLSPLIRAGKIKEAQARAYVKGSGINGYVHSYSGYLQVNKDVCNSNLFFWFIPATVSTLKIWLYIYIFNISNKMDLDSKVSDQYHHVCLSPPRPSKVISPMETYLSIHCASVIIKEFSFSRCFGHDFLCLCSK